MKHFINILLVAVFLSYNCTPLNAQSQDTCNHCEVYKRAFHLKSSDTINQILINPELNLSNKDKAELYGIRSLLTYRLNKNKDYYNQILKDSILNDINISTGFNTGDENLKYIFRRHITRTQQLDLNPIDNDLILLKHNGYKSQKSGLGLRFSIRKDENYWGGIELALFSVYEPSYKLKVDTVLIDLRKFTTAYSALVFGYSKSLTNNFQEVKLSLLKFESPIYIDIAQFGIIQQYEQNSVFYRPEIGFASWGFSLSYGINLYLNNPSLPHPNRHSINLRYLYTFNKSKY
jgi:hypothetical protein